MYVRSSKGGRGAGLKGLFTYSRKHQHAPGAHQPTRGHGVVSRRGKAGRGTASFCVLRISRRACGTDGKSRFTGRQHIGG